MGTPTIQPIEGQGGNISIYSSTGGQIIIQVANWQIRKIFYNADVTVTCSGGWREYKRVLAGWDFTADWPYDATAARVGVYDGVKLVNNIYVPIGMEYPVAGLCIFQLGAAGMPGNDGTFAMQYRGKALISTTSTQNPAKDIVHFTISGQGTGPLVGPTAGLLSS